VRNYLKRVYGTKAFHNDGTIKVMYIDKALKETKDNSLRDALRLAKRFIKHNL
jgi:hypothetical protein